MFSKLSRSQYATPVYIFIFFLGFYLITSQGLLLITDSKVNFQTTRALVETKSLAIPCMEDERFINKDSSGKCYSKYDPGLAISAIPFYLLGRAFYGPAIPDVNSGSKTLMVTGTLSQFIAAATCAILYLFAVHLSGSPSKSFDLVILFGICTLAWPYASQFFSQPLVGLLLLTAVFILVINNDNFRIGRFVLAGSALGWACFTRLDTLPLILIINVYAFYQIRQKSLPWYTTMRFMAALLLPIIMALIAYFTYQFIRDGQWFRIGYEEEGWDTPFAVGLFGLLFSTGKGIIFYSPLVLLAFIGLYQLWKQGWMIEVILISFLFITQVAIYASWWAWDGGWTWGPRFLISTQPLLILGLLPWLNRSKYPQILLILAFLGYLVQMIGVTTTPAHYMVTTSFLREQILFAPEASPILGQLQSLRQLRVTLFIANQGYGFFSRAEIAVFILVCVFLMTFGGINAVRAVRRESKLA